MITASIFEAKTNLSHLVKQAQKGEVVTITSGRARPSRRLEAKKNTTRLRKSGLASLRRPDLSCQRNSLSRCRKTNYGSGMAAASEGPARHLHSYLGHTFSFVTKPRSSGDDCR